MFFVTRLSDGLFVFKSISSEICILGKICNNLSGFLFLSVCYFVGNLRSRASQSI